MGRICPLRRVGRFVPALVSYLNFSLAMIGLWIVNIVLSLMAGLAANRGEPYRYPYASSPAPAARGRYQPFLQFGGVLSQRPD